jgi:hypothetical protein
MDIGTQAEVYLREAGYDTWTWSGTSPAVICFENSTLVGFLHVFTTAADLMAKWEEAQLRVLSRYSAALRAGGAKAWNVYSVFLTSEKAPKFKRPVERLEEDFTLTRKIARTEIQTVEDISHVLMPLVPIKAQPLLENANVADRLRSRAKDVPAAALTAFLGSPTPDEIAEILGSRT